jgi:hypothetical protein
VVQIHQIHVMDVHEFNGVVTMVISQPTDMLEPRKWLEMVYGGIVESGRSLDGISCVVDC